MPDPDLSILTEEEKKTELAKFEELERLGVYAVMLPDGRCEVPACVVHGNQAAVIRLIAVD